LKLACRLAEKAYLAAQVALVWHTDAEELRTFDEMLWTFMDGSFVPHDMVITGLTTGATPGPTSTAALNEAPVLLSAGIQPPANVDIIINLAPEIPPCLSRACRVAEIIDGDDARRRAGRARFKAYRDLGIQPASHNIRGDP
jgi:DNA polymerase-3 subunit chi